MNTTATSCIFCEIVAGNAPATILTEWDDAIAIKPRGGIDPTHTLIIPRVHVADAGTDPIVTAATMARAAEIMGQYENANLVTSRGRLASQTVFHLHVHVYERTMGDGIATPWPNPANPF